MLNIIKYTLFIKRNEEQFKDQTKDSNKALEFQNNSSFNFGPKIDINRIRNFQMPRKPSFN